MHIQLVLNKWLEDDHQRQKADDLTAFTARKLDHLSALTAVKEKG